MPRVDAVPLAIRQARGMRGRAAKAFETFYRDLERRGCAAMRYRLSGRGYESLCVQHVYGSWRAVVAFPEPDGRLAAIVMVGQHDESSSENVYGLLYELVGHEPELGAGRTKPSCCDGETGQPPVTDEHVVEALSQQTRRLR